VNLKAAPFGWRSELLYVALGAIEILWLTPWFMLIMPGARDLSTTQIILFIAANLIGSLLVVRMFTVRHANEMVLRVAFLGGLLFAVWLTFQFILPLSTFGAEPPLFANGVLFVSPALISMGVIGLLWYRGLQIATITVSTARASYALRIGIILEIAAAFIANARIQRTALILLPGFFFFGLLATGMARSANLRIDRDVQRSTFGAGWILFTAVLGGALSLIGFMAALLISGFRFDAILNAIGQVFSAILLAFVTLVWPLFTLLARFIDSILRAVTGRTQALQITTPGAFLSRLAGPQNSAAHALLEYAPALFAMGGVLVFVVVILLTLRQRARVRLGDNEQRESLDNAAILSSLQATLQRGLDTLRDALSGLSHLGDHAAAAFTIRRLYARLCALAEKRGYARSTAQTPFEYQPMLITAFPDFESEIGLLTRAYVNVHYGELPDEPDALQTARAALDRMEQTKIP